MLPYRSRFVVPVVVVVVVAALGVAPACNSVLDNRAGVLADGGVGDPRTSTPGTEPEPGSEGNASSGGSGASSGTSSSSGSTSSGGTSSGTTPPGTTADAGTDAGAADAGAADAGTPAVDAAAPDAGLACPPGFADCDHVAANGCEAELANDRHNCGQCGAFCLIGKCREGVCRL